MSAGFTLGIDVGSAYIKCALINYGSHPDVVELTTEKIRKRNPTIIIEQAVQKLLANQGLAYEDILYVASTGVGDLVPRKRGHFYSMTTHARGAYHYHPTAREVPTKYWSPMAGSFALREPKAHCPTK